MKKLISLMLTAMMLLCPCAALAQGGALGGLMKGKTNADITAKEREPINPGVPIILEEVDYEVVQYTLSEAGMSVELPEAWLVMTEDLGAQSPLADLYSMSDEEVRETLEPMGAHLYAMTNLLGSGQVFIITVDGMGFPDMRYGAEGLDIEEFVMGFTMFAPNLEIFECGLHQMGESWYTRTYFFDEVDNIPMVSIQYATTINETQYVIQYMKMNSMELNESMIAQADTMVASVHFLNED